ncbi:hypothetical protein ACTMU2_37485 [Cupriavidus basilensis]
MRRLGRRETGLAVCRLELAIARRLRAGLHELLTHPAGRRDSLACPYPVLRDRRAAAPGIMPGWPPMPAAGGRRCKLRRACPTLRDPGPR